MSVCSQKTFKWSERELTLKELIAEYREQVPFPVIVTQGYMPEHGRNSVSSVDEVYWVHDVIAHTWIVLVNEFGAEFKIPECYRASIVPIKADGKDDNVISFCNARQTGGFKYFKFLEPKHKVITGEDGEATDYHMGVLEIVDVYEENYLVVHPIYMENLTMTRSDGDNSRRNRHAAVVFPTFDLLPAYLPTCVSIGVALCMAPAVIYFHTMAEIKIVADSYSHQPQYPARLRDTADILLTHDKNPSSDSDYEYIDMSNPTTKKHQEQSSTFKIPLNLRNDPVALTVDVDPNERLRNLRIFYDTGDIADSSAAISDLEDDGYLEPRTWLALEATNAASHGVCDDVFHSEMIRDKKQKSTSEQVDPAGATKGPGISWLKERLLGAARLQKPNDSPAGTHGIPLLSVVFSNQWHKPEEPTKRHVSVADRIMALSSKTVSTPRDSLPPPEAPPPPPPQPRAPMTRADGLRSVPPPPPAPPPPVSPNRRSSNAAFSEERMKPKSSLSIAERKHSFDSKQTSIISPMRTTANGGKGDLVAELKSKFSPRTVSLTGSLQQSSQTRIKHNKRIACIDDIPKDIACLSPDDITDCLQCLHISEYAPPLRQAMVDGSLLLCLEEEHLTRQFGFTDFDARKLMKFAKNGWRPKL